MKGKFNSIHLAALAAFLFAANFGVFAQAEKRTLNTDPEQVKIVTSDIDLFWKAYDMAKSGNKVDIFRDEYLEKGSIGLKDFTKARIESAEQLAATIDKHPKYYASLRAVSRKAGDFRPPIVDSFRKLKAIYPDAVFPDVYIVIGRMSSGGTLTPNALLIGMEMYGMTPETPTEELGTWHRQVLGTIDRIPNIVAHELIHYQQKFTDKQRTLLSASIGEGSADFIAQLISGKHINHHLHEFGDPRERELWLDFERSLQSGDISLWLYNGSSVKDRPADLGYYMGYKIVESFYNNAKDKKQAVKEILEIKDFNEFLKASRYEEKFTSIDKGTD